MSDTSDLTERDMAMALGLRDIEIIRLTKRLERLAATRTLEGMAAASGIYTREPGFTNPVGAGEDLPSGGVHRTPNGPTPITTRQDSA
jgi:hypothetical protein